MMQTETALPPPVTCARWPSFFNRIGRHRLLLGGAAIGLLAGGFVWQWSWLVAIGAAPLLISVAPCVAMCALGLCMYRMGNSASSVTPQTPTLSLPSENPSTQQES